MFAPAAAPPPPTPAAPPTTEPTSTPGGRARLWPWALASLIVLGFVGGVTWHIVAPKPDVWTDNAYVRVHYAAIAPRVSGQVTAVHVQNDDTVRAGQVLVELDDRDYQTALDQAKADVASAEADIRNTDAQLVEQQSVIAQAEAAIVSDNAAVKFAKDDYDRYKKMTAGRITSVQDAQRAQTVLEQQTAHLQSDRAALAAAHQRIEVLNSARAKAETQITRLQAVEKQAKLNLSYTKVLAPLDGMVAQRGVQVGNYVSSGTGLMAVVPLSELYVEANYREVELKHVQAGQRARIHVDAYDIDLEGTVVGVPAATGATFATIQADNATGNFTKIVQRLPVRIVIAPHQPLARLLRVGLSVETTIETKLADVVAQQLDAARPAVTDLATSR